MRLYPSVIILPALVLASCGSIKTTAPETNPTDMPKGPGLFSGESGNILSAFNKTAKDKESAGNIGVNIYLWQAALQNLSFMPIKTADSNGGVIATDWYTQPEKPNEKFRANILILGKKLQASGLQVTIFKQVKDAKGVWQDVPVSPSTVRALEDTILTKARALRVQALASE
jgi:hypothetical protein